MRPFDDLGAFGKLCAEASRMRDSLVKHPTQKTDWSSQRRQVVVLERPPIRQRRSIEIPWEGISLLRCW